MVLSAWGEMVLRKSICSVTRKITSNVVEYLKERGDLKIDSISQFSFIGDVSQEP